MNPIRIIVFFFIGGISQNYGTGLGLSLSYDIIKAHGGELKVESKEGDGAEFLIQIPV